MPDVGQTEIARREFEALIAPALGPAYGTALHMTGRREAAEDLVQEAALQAFKGFHSFRQGSNFKAWFFRIMINRFRYNYRQRTREPDTTFIDDAPDLYLYVQASSAGLLDQSSDPAAVVIDRLSEEQIEGALAALPEEFRIVCTLYFMEELPYQEIAEIVSCPVGTVRSRLHRGRKLLQKALWVVAHERGLVGALRAEKEGIEL